MSNQIKPTPMFHTPESWKEVADWIEAHPREDRVHLYTAAGMTWNLAVAVTQSETEDA